MHDSLTSANWRDFSQRYQGTYGWLCNNNKEIPVLIESVSESMVVFKGLGGEEYFTYADRDVKFKFMPLNRQLVLGGNTGSLYYISRQPARQWSRGICANNTRIQQLHANGRITSRDVNNTIMDDILKASKENNQTVGNITLLNNMFAVCGGFVWLYNQAIGTYENGVITMGANSSVFAQELQDTLRDIKSNILVV